MNITKQIMAWADRVLPNNYLILILLAILMIGLPVFPRAYLLGKYAALLNLSALFAILFIWTLVREYRNDLTHIIDGRRLGLDPADFDVDESLFSRPFYFLTSTVGLFLGLWAVITGSVAAVFYNLCVASELYCPFDQEPTRLGVALFFADQASKGMFFDAMEVFNVGVRFNNEHESVSAVWGRSRCFPTICCFQRYSTFPSLSFCLRQREGRTPCRACEEADSKIVKCSYGARGLTPSRKET